MPQHCPQLPCRHPRALRRPTLGLAAMGSAAVVPAPGKVTACRGGFLSPSCGSWSPRSPQRVASVSPRAPQVFARCWAVENYPLWEGCGPVPSYGLEINAWFCLCSVTPRPIWAAGMGFPWWGQGGHSPVPSPAAHRLWERCVGGVKLQGFAGWRGSHGSPVSPRWWRWSHGSLLSPAVMAEGWPTGPHCPQV